VNDAEIKSALLNENNLDTAISVLKITALWAFSESALGGILHALTIPFRGLFINAAAVLFISLIALFAKSSKEILKSTLIVILIKALVSPHTPLTAYFAVSIQGLFGYLFFLSQKFFRLSTLLLGIFTLFFSGIQKVIVLTILFGNTFWSSINVFVKQVLSEFLSFGINLNVNYGKVIIFIYIGVHILIGIFIGFYAGLLPKIIQHYSQQIPKIILESSEDIILNKDRNRKKKKWLFRPTGIFVLVISVTMIIYSYISPSIKDNIALEIIIMLIRSVLLTTFWYLFLAPIVKKLFNKYLAGKSFVYTKEIAEILNMFPQFRKVVAYCWKSSSNKKGFNRVHYFFSTSFYYLLLYK
jgi:hypothetical protein